jgi:hypothetical protein
MADVDVSPAVSYMAALPDPLLLRILAALPVDSRLRATEVCRAWHALLTSDHRMWTTLDVSASSLARAEHATDALLRCAAARAGGRLHRLIVSGVADGDEASGMEHWGVTPGGVRMATLLELAAQHRETLRELHIVSHDLGVAEVHAVFAAAPELQLLRADLYADSATATALLLAQPAFAPRLLRTWCHGDWNAVAPDNTPVLELAAHLRERAHPPSSLCVESAWQLTRVALDALVDVALETPLRELMLRTLDLTATVALAPLLRLLRADSALECLSLDCEGRDEMFDESLYFLDVDAATQLGAALRAHPTLTTLHVDGLYVFRTPAAAAALLDVLVGHGSIRQLSMSGCHLGGWAPWAELVDCSAVGASLGALVAANAPALEALYVHWCMLGPTGLTPLFEALPRNTHLRELHCGENRKGAAFEEHVMLPAVRANTSLRLLGAIHPQNHGQGARPKQVHEFAAEQLVAARAAAEALLS